MRTVGRMRIVSLDEVPGLMEQLKKQPPDPAEIERRHRLSAQADKVVDEMTPWEVDVKEMIHDDWLRKTE